jgi:hypothetical protein
MSSIITFTYCSKWNHLNGTTLRGVPPFDFLILTARGKVIFVQKIIFYEVTTNTGERSTRDGEKIVLYEENGFMCVYYSG